MLDIRTNVCIGGLLDGQRVPMDEEGTYVPMTHGYSVERGAPPPTEQPPRDSGTVDLTYERAAYEGDRHRFLFWKVRGLTMDDAVNRLFARYTGETDVPLLQP